MATIDLEGRSIPVQDGDTVGSALFRAGVRTLTRSLKSHRRRGLYCLTGDCANCIVTVDGVPGERACMTPARAGMRVDRESGWPSAEHDLLSVADHLHALMPVGFYYKAFVRPRFAWSLADKVIRRATGTGRLPLDRQVEAKPTRHERTELLVIGAGPAGLAAAAEAAAAGERVLLVEEGIPGAMLAPGDTHQAVTRLAREAATAGVRVLTLHAALGVYEGPTVPVLGPRELVEVVAERVIVATGAIETHGVFAGNDLPGVWLGRGAARMAAVHGVRLGGHAVVVAATTEGAGHAETLRRAGVDVTEVAGTVREARGRTRITSVTVDTPDGRRAFACDALVLSLGLAPRDALLRMDDTATGAGDVVLPGCTVDEAIESGRIAARGERSEAPAPQASTPGGPPSGFVCPCEDVVLGDLEVAWREGWTSAEILKRYTTATMGPCQGALCSNPLAAFAASMRGSEVPEAVARTTARPPVRGPRLEELAGGVHEVIDRRTALHDRHVAGGARMDRSGSWLRPGTYGDTEGEIRAVRERVSVMDVSTLGKFLVAGRDARELLTRVFPIDVAGVAPGRARYVLALDEAGYVTDDGMLAALPDGYYLTTTSGGSDRMEAWMRDRADRFDLRAHIVNRTATLGAINVAGPHARDLLETLSDDDLSRGALPYPGTAEITVAGVRCRVLSSGFVGELAFELHHQRGESEHLWDALVVAGQPWELRPHGLDALDVLRLEKGHVYLGQDTLPDDHPAKLGLGWAVAGGSGFAGEAALLRMDALPLERRLVGLRFDGRPLRGSPLETDGRVVGRVTSCADSAAAGGPIGLGGSEPSTAGSRPPWAAGRRPPPFQRRRSGTRRGCACVGEPRDAGTRRPVAVTGPAIRPAVLDVVLCQASAAALDRLVPPGHGARLLRTAADEALAIVPPGVGHDVARELSDRAKALEADALVLDVTDGWAGWVLPGADRAFPYVSSLEPPSVDGFVQGEVAHVAAKVLAGPDPGELTILVPAYWGEHLRERLEHDIPPVTHLHRGGASSTSGSPP